MLHSLQYLLLAFFSQSTHPANKEKILSDVSRVSGQVENILLYLCVIQNHSIFIRSEDSFRNFLLIFSSLSSLNFGVVLGYSRCVNRVFSSGCIFYMKTNYYYVSSGVICCVEDS